MIMNRKTPRQIHCLLIVLTMISVTAHADIALPMLVVVWPISWLLLIPVILLEGIIARRILNENWSQSLKLSGKANVISTFIGIPVVWTVLTFALLITSELGQQTLPEYITSVIFLLGNAVWLTPNASSTDSIVTIAAAALYIPFYFASVWIEALVGWKLFPNTDKPLIKRWSVVANFWSYAITIMALLIWSVLV